MRLPPQVWLLSDNDSDSQSLTSAASVTFTTQYQSLLRQRFLGVE